MRRVAALLCALLLSCSQLWGEPVETRSLAVKHAPVSALLPICRDLYPWVHCEAGHKAILATGTKKTLAVVEAFIESVDVKPRKILLDVRRISLRDDGIKHLGRSS